MTYADNVELIRETMHGVIELPLKRYGAPDGLDALVHSLAADLVAP